jgi:uncharacterized protein (DUF1499 family)
VIVSSRFRPLGVAFFSALGILLLVGCSSSGDPLPDAQPSNPLPECPSSPNCERMSADYDVPADRLFADARDALAALGPVTLRADADSMRAHAVYRVALVFKDDVDVAVDSTATGSVLHVRSASRLGYDDLGVNRRRMQRLLSAVGDSIQAPAE